MCIGPLPGILLNTWPSLFCLFLAWIWSLVAKQTLVGAKIRQPNCDKTYLSSTKRRYLFKNNWIYPRVSVSHMHLSSLFLLCKIWTNIDQLIRLHSNLVFPLVTPRQCSFHHFLFLRSIHNVLDLSIYFPWLQTKKKSCFLSSSHSSNLWPCHISDNSQTFFLLISQIFVDQLSVYRQSLSRQQILKFSFFFFFHVHKSFLAELYSFGGFGCLSDFPLVYIWTL